MFSDFSPEFRTAGLSMYLNTSHANEPIKPSDAATNLADSEPVQEMIYDEVADESGVAILLLLRSRILATIIFAVAFLIYLVDIFWYEFCGISCRPPYKPTDTKI